MPMGISLPYFLSKIKRVFTISYMQLQNVPVENWVSLEVSSLKNSIQIFPFLKQSKL